MRAIGNNKVCSACKQMLDISQFYKNRYSTDGLANQCRSCHRQGVREYAKTKKGQANDKRKAYSFRSKSPEKYKARQSIMYAVYSGKMLRPSSCSRCDADCIPHAHHEDYSKPLDVMWLCDSCHKLKHGKLVDMSLMKKVKEI